MNRMLCVISGQMLPNFIPLNEPATRPEALHAIFTPGDPAMAQRWENLRRVVQRLFPQIELHGEPVANAYDPREIQQKCFSLLREHLNDNWTLNATGGTKLMSAPAMEVFRTARLYEEGLGERRIEIIYVETPKNNTLRLNHDWKVMPLPFESSIDIQTYFELYNQHIGFENNPNLQERDLVGVLRRFDWRIWLGIQLLRGKQDEAAIYSYDVLCLKHYQLYAFECKTIHRISESLTASEWKVVQELKKDQVQIDLLKLLALKERFGGPFGKIFWVFEGDYPLTLTDEQRMRDFGIRFIRQEELLELREQPHAFGLPFDLANDQ
ncbi:MAG: DUF1887 family CARF protein [Acidobacteria bacterium]|nr:DUF1887 family CARF protein [Acidobacteriota bacterium]